jgi:hypothetical protein
MKMTTVNRKGSWWSDISKRLYSIIDNSEAILLPWKSSKQPNSNPKTVPKIGGVLLGRGDNGELSYLVTHRQDETGTLPSSPT